MHRLARTPSRRLSRRQIFPTVNFVRIYLDACCLNRPFDDQSQVRVHLESEAVLAVIERAEDGRWTLLSSATLEFELAQMPDPRF